MESITVFEEEHEEYDEWYEKNQIHYHNEVKLLKSLLANKEHEYPVIEIGVGTGRFASKLNINIGIDPAINMLIKAKKRGIEVIRGIGEHLPLRENSLNTIVMIVTLCFLRDPKQALAETKKALKKEGELIVCFIPKDSSWGKYYLSKKEKSPFYKQARFYTRRKVEELLEKTGFKIVTKKSILRYSPTEKPYIDEPIENTEGSFVCYKAKKR